VRLLTQYWKVRIRDELACHLDRAIPLLLTTRASHINPYLVVFSDAARMLEKSNLFVGDET
jgi:hypothetical protein